MQPIVWYVSGHGFGHASRDIEIINALYDITLNKNSGTTLVRVFEDLDRHIERYLEGDKAS